MIVDFQIIHRIKENLKVYILEILNQTLNDSTIIEYPIEEKPDNIEEWSIFDWIEIKYNYGINSDKFITGFTLKIDENINIIKDFGEFLKNDDNIEIVFKYFDDFMLSEHKRYMQEIFEIEMKLREIFSFIFIDTYKDKYFNLLEEIDIKIQPLIKHNNRPNEEYFKSHFENEFFFLLFSDYLRLDQLKKINQVDIAKMIKNSNNFDELKRNIQNRGITKEKYKDLIASIKENIQPIENMRNCTAHNRTFTNEIVENYEKAKNNLDKKISQFWEEIQNK